MAKFGDLDSGGGEAPAILGEDLGVGLNLLLRPIQVSARFSDLAQLAEKDLALGVLGVLLAVEAYCLWFAYQHQNPLLAFLVLGLMGAEVYTFWRAANPLVEPLPQPLLVGARCRVCKQDFVHEQGHRKGSAPPRRWDEPPADICSHACERTLHQRARAA